MIEELPRRAADNTLCSSENIEGRGRGSLEGPKETKINDRETVIRGGGS